MKISKEELEFELKHRIKMEFETSLFFVWLFVILFAGTMFMGIFIDFIFVFFFVVIEVFFLFQYFSAKEKYKRFFEK